MASFSIIVQRMKSYIRGVDSSVDVSEGTMLNDIVISAPGREVAQLYSNLDTVSRAQSIETASDLALESLGGNVGIVRKSSRKARGTVVFFANSAPTTDIVIPAGTIVSTVPTSASSAIQFVTTRTVTIYSDFVSVYLNPATGRYEVASEIDAVVAGTTGNVGSTTITTLVSGISSINGCYNTTSTSGGLDTESLDSLRGRIAARWSGGIIGTEDGILSAVFAQEGVEDAVVVGHGETGRSELGAIDVYIKGTNSQSQTDAFATTTSIFSDLILTKQPVLTSGVTEILSSASGSISSGVWSLTKDVSVLEGSVRAQDMIEWSTPPDSSYGSVFITYSYNGLVDSIQNLFAKTNRDVLNSDILIKWAREIPIDITCSIKLLAGFDSNSVTSLIGSEVSSFLSENSIGEELQQADVVQIMLNVPGVDDILLPFTTFRSSDSTILPNSFNNLTIPVYGYVSAGTFTFNVIT